MRVGARIAGEANNQMVVVKMVETFMVSRHFKCPECNQMGMVAKQHPQDEFRLVGNRFRLEGHEGKEIVCIACRVPVVTEVAH